MEKNADKTAEGSNAGLDMLPSVDDIRQLALNNPILHRVIETGSVNGLTLR